MFAGRTCLHFPGRLLTGNILSALSGSFALSRFCFSLSSAYSTSPRLHSTLMSPAGIVFSSPILFPAISNGYRRPSGAPRRPAVGDRLSVFRVLPFLPIGRRGVLAQFRRFSNFSRVRFRHPLGRPSCYYFSPRASWIFGTLRYRVEGTKWNNETNRYDTGSF